MSQPPANQSARSGIDLIVAPERPLFCTDLPIGLSLSARHPASTFRSHSLSTLLIPLECCLLPLLAILADQSLAIGCSDI